MKLGALFYGGDGDVYLMFIWMITIAYASRMIMSSDRNDCRLPLGTSYSYIIRKLCRHFKISINTFLMSVREVFERRSLVVLYRDVYRKEIYATAKEYKEKLYIN